MVIQPSTSRAKGAGVDDGVSEFAKRLTIPETTPLLTPCEGRAFLPMDLNQVQRLSFGLGHVINDITGVLWFSYALLFFEFIVHLSSTTSAALLFLGQLTDALVTPFVGILVAEYSSKKKWHFLGVILIAVAFPFVFHYWSYSSPYWSTILIYALAIIMFQLGWTFVQTAHLSLIPEITLLLQERIKLTTLRYTIFVCSNIAIYVVAYFVLRGRRGNGFNIVDSRDATKFEIIALLAVILGFFSSLVFQSVIRVPSSSKTKKQSYIADPLRWREILRLCWSSKILHYVTIVHTASRVFHSLNLVYMPFYINEIHVLDTGMLAIAPLLSFVGSLVACVVISYTSKIYTNHKILYTTGILFSLLSCLCLLVNYEDRVVDSSLIYSASLFYGIGSSLTIVKSLCIAANFVGTNTEDAAFMYGIITFFDKIINGVIILFVEYMKSTSFINDYHYYKFVLTILSGSIIGVGYIFLQLLPSSICYSSIE